MSGYTYNIKVDATIDTTGVSLSDGIKVRRDSDEQPFVIYFEPVTTVMPGQTLRIDLKVKYAARCSVDDRVCTYSMI